MKIFTNKKYSKTIEKVKRESYEEGFNLGYDRGKSKGIHLGLTSDKKGIHLNSNGMYVFDNVNE